MPRRVPQGSACLRPYAAGLDLSETLVERGREARTNTPSGDVKKSEREVGLDYKSRGRASGIWVCNAARRPHRREASVGSSG